MRFLNVLRAQIHMAVKSEKGQSLVEYGLVLLLIALVVILMVKGIGGWTSNSYSSVNNAFP